MIYIIIYQSYIDNISIFFPKIRNEIDMILRYTNRNCTHKKLSEDYNMWTRYIGDLNNRFSILNSFDCCSNNSMLKFEETIKNKNIGKVF